MTKQLNNPRVRFDISINATIESSTIFSNYLTTILKTFPFEVKQWIVGLKFAIPVIKSSVKQPEEVPREREYAICKALRMACKCNAALTRGDKALLTKLASAHIIAQYSCKSQLQLREIDVYCTS